jgi:NAD+ synthase
MTPKANPLKINPAKETELISSWIRKMMLEKIKRRGLVVSLSGGVDSSVTASLCIRALGKERVFGLLMPEQESSEDTPELSIKAAESLGIEYEELDITPILKTLGCYVKRDTAIKRLIPEYGEGWKSKLVFNNVLDSDQLRYFSICAVSPDGRKIDKRLDTTSYLEIVAATNFKQRVRKMIEYHHADRLNYAVAGTPNRLEYDQGFFVKLGDGAADIKPIAHLYKTQVYRIAEYLDVPKEIRERPPTTDTYSLPQSQEEFFFALPYDKMDLCLFGINEGLSAEETAGLTGLDKKQVERVYWDIEKKRCSSEYLHLNSVMMEL